MKIRAFKIGETATIIEDNELRDFLWEHTSIEDFKEWFNEFNEPVSIPVLGEIPYGELVEKLLSNEEWYYVTNDLVDMWAEDILYNLKSDGYDFYHQIDFSVIKEDKNGTLPN